MRKKFGSTIALYPSLTVLAGATVNGKPNFITIAHVGIRRDRGRSFRAFLYWLG